MTQTHMAKASVAELICQALVDVGDKRPLYPGKTGQESALCFLAKFLRAKNPINTEMSAQKVRTQLEERGGPVPASRPPHPSNSPN